MSKVSGSVEHILSLSLSLKVEGRMWEARQGKAGETEAKKARIAPGTRLRFHLHLGLGASESCELA